MTSPSAPQPQGLRLRLYPGVLLVIVALAAMLRGLVIGRDTLWLDEGYSWWDAQQRMTALWTLVPTCDPHPPLYFALLHPWIAVVGDGTVAMRLLSTLFGLLTIAVVYVAGRELDRARGHGDDRFGIGALAALLFALTPFQVYFSIEARPYALLCLGAAMLTLACLQVVRAVESPQRRRAFAWTDRIPGRSGLLLLAGALIVVWT
ncbi:MAG: glycosyltransferase family 39 protein, partial [Burkholderiaceae bacterium]